VSEQTATDPKFTIPRDKGKPREVSRIQPGWWVHLMAEPGEQLDIPDGWEQVDYIMSAVGIYILVFHGDQPDITLSGRATAITLTEREAAKLGMRAAEVSP
jgi:hypothetical protein